jgi:hypothetical protein
MGALLTKGRAKGEDFGATAKGVVESWVLGQVFHRSAMWRSKYTEKGTFQEQSAIELAESVLGWFAPEKNERFFEDEHFTGTPDLILPNEVVDIKSPWSIDTFPYFDATIPEPAYFAQLQVYMALTGKEKASLVYCLVDAPDFLIEREAAQQAREQGLEDVPIELFEKVARKMTFADIEPRKRVKVYSFDRDDNMIALYRDRVEAAREFVPSLISQIEAL